MSENLPDRQPEICAWAQELPLHSELDGKLKPKETLALIGSFTVSSLEGYEQDNEHGTLSDHELSKQQRTHSAALEQLAAFKVDNDDHILSTIVERRMHLQEVLADIENDPRRFAEAQRLHDQLAGVKLLDDINRNVEDIVDSLAQTYGDFKRTNPRNRTAAINELIKQHNVEASPNPESIVDVPEVHEAQERINAHYAEQAKQPHPTETVDDIRKKVTEAYGDSGEKERQALLEEVMKAATGNTRIYTDIPSGVVLKSIEGEYKPDSDGFLTFGDGLSQRDRKFVTERLTDTAYVEAFIIVPDMVAKYKTTVELVETGGRFNRKLHKVERQVHDGEAPLRVTNQLTGHKEPGIKVAYQFNGGERGGYNNRIVYEGPKYATENGRSGNMLKVEATLPQSVADKLKDEVTRNPNVAREFAKMLAIQNGITEQAWNRVVSPPFDELPKDWEMAITNSQIDTRYDDARHTVISRQTVEVSR